IVSYFIRDKKGPGAKPVFEYTGVSNDKFVVIIGQDSEMTDERSEQICDMLAGLGALEVEEREEEEPAGEHE
ncbi:MAG: hypothetical protein JW861_01730, partial [Bacteroidales bacterium]|nr:hypothetical protein [Bacteroidales bacterium]